MNSLKFANGSIIAEIENIKRPKILSNWTIGRCQSSDPVSTIQKAKSDIRNIKANQLESELFKKVLGDVAPLKPDSFCFDGDCAGCIIVSEIISF